ncbi:MAG: PEP-CTERM sorting domain-containing protein [Planctomycetes bacterium]|nr:PEP-CTERM sorting domain-containing protein [Planctomycetota bacterium]
MKWLIAGFAAVVVLAFAGPAHASFILTLGDVELLSSSPLSVEVDALESNDKAWTFTERVGLKLSGDFTVNIVAPGRYNGLIVKDIHSIPVNQFIDTHFVSFDPVGRPTKSDPASFAQGSMTFDQDVLAIITHHRQLWDTEALGFGASGTDYPPNNVDFGRGVDAVVSAYDFVELSTDRRTVSFAFAARTPGDQFRVVTASAVPEPSSLVLWLVGAAVGFGAWRRRRKR